MALSSRLKKMLEIRFFFLNWNLLWKRKLIWFIGWPVSLEPRQTRLIFPQQRRSCGFRSLLRLQVCQLRPVPGQRDHMNTTFWAKAKEWICSKSPICWLDSSRPAVEGEDGGSLPACRARCSLHRRPPCQDPADRSDQSIPDRPRRSSRSWLEFCRSRDGEHS